MNAFTRLVELRRREQPDREEQRGERDHEEADAVDADDVADAERRRSSGGSRRTGSRRDRSELPEHPERRGRGWRRSPRSRPRATVSARAGRDEQHDQRADRRRGDDRGEDREAADGVVHQRAAQIRRYASSATVPSTIAERVVADEAASATVGGRPPVSRTSQPDAVHRAVDDPGVEHPGQPAGEAAAAGRRRVARRRRRSSRRGRSSRPNDPEPLVERIPVDRLQAACGTARRPHRARSGP